MNHRSSLLSVAFGVAALLVGSRDAFAAPGYYSVAEIDGVWWFVDPDGRPFYSLGIDDTKPGPASDDYDPQRPAYAAFRHYESTENWAAHTLQRFKDWQFNTIGAWGDASLLRGPLPYAVALHLGGGDYVPWNDLFSDAFEAEIEQLARRLVAPHRSDRNLLGWFSDNELKWYPDTIFQYHLAKVGSVTRGKLLELLAEHYHGDFAALAGDFEVTGASNFEELAQGGRLKLRPGGDGRQVILWFTAAVAERYYQVVHDAIRRYDPHHLILGDRYPWHCPDVVARAAAPYVDVISTNLDWPEASDGYLPAGYLRNLHRITGRPVLVTEYYVAARENRSGNKNTGGTFLTVGTQAERAAAFENRLRILASQPYVVGAHWFRFADEPPDGRPSDGEDYNFGLVDIDNRPYDKLTTAMARLHASVPALHAKSRIASETPPGPIRIPLVRTDIRDLHQQLCKTRSLGPAGESLKLYETLAAWSPERLYLVALVCHVSERESYSAAVALEGHELELEIALPTADAPVRVQFGGTKRASADVAGVECWLSENGLRHTLVVALPAPMLGTTSLNANQRLALALSLRDVLDRQSIAWEHEFLLVSDEEPKAGGRPQSFGVPGGE